MDQKHSITSCEPPISSQVKVSLTMATRLVLFHQAHRCVKLAGWCACEI